MFKSVCGQWERGDLLQAATYGQAKVMATAFQQAKAAVYKQFKVCSLGEWVSKPVEEEMFS